MLVEGPGPGLGRRAGVFGEAALHRVSACFLSLARWWRGCLCTLSSQGTWCLSRRPLSPGPSFSSPSGRIVSPSPSR